MAAVTGLRSQIMDLIMWDEDGKLLLCHKDTPNPAQQQRRYYGMSAHHWLVSQPHMWRWLLHSWWTVPIQ